MPDLDELRPLLEHDSANRIAAVRSPLPDNENLNSAEAVGLFWAALYSMALGDISEMPHALVVSHDQLASAGRAGAQRLFTVLGLPWNRAASREFDDNAYTVQRQRTQSTALHNLRRNPSQVASQWHNKLPEDEFSTIDHVTSSVRSQLESAQLPLD